MHVDQLQTIYSAVRNSQEFVSFCFLSVYLFSPFQTYNFERLN